MIATATKTAKAAAPRPRGRTPIERLLLHPFTAFFLTFGIRFALFSCRYAVEPYLAAPLIPHPSYREVTGAPTPANARAASPATAYVSGTTGERQVTPPPVHFSIWMPATEAATWREVVFWRERGFITSEGQGVAAGGGVGIPYYLQALAPWYAPYIPAILASPPWSGFALSVMDGVTAALVAQWDATSAALLYAFFVLNPLEVLGTAYESLTAWELLLMTLTVYLCAHRRHSALVYAAAVACALVLGSAFIAAPVALLAPIGVAHKQRSFLTAAMLVLGVGAYAVMYLYKTQQSHRYASMYAPPDNGVMWYVRQLVIATFGRCQDIFMLQLAPILIIPMTLAFPSAYVHGEHTASATPSSVAPPPRVFTDVRVFLVVLALGMSVLFRAQITLPYCFLVVLLVYSCLNPAASKTVRLENQRVVVYSVSERVRLLVPIFIQLTTVPLQISFYAGWVLRETANANWKFFSDVGFMVGSTAFLVMWYAEVVDDAISYSRAVLRGRVEATVTSCVTAAAAAAAAPDRVAGTEEDAKSK